VLLDGAEVFYNFFFGKTPIASANLSEAKDFGSAFATTMQYQNITTQNSDNGFTINPIDMSGIRFAGHSGGGERLYMGVLGGANSLDLGSDQYGNKNKSLADIVRYDGTKAIYEPKVAVQFYGTPSYTGNLGKAANKAGAYMAHTGSQEQGNLNYQLGHQINPGDPVADILGGNSFLPGKQSSPIEFGRSVISLPLLFFDNISPHSNYLCQGVFCNPSQLQQVIKQNSTAQ
jgi:hypothetical protein